LRSNLLLGLALVCVWAALLSCGRGDPDPTADATDGATPHVQTPTNDDRLVADGWVTGSGSDAVVRDSYGRTFRPLSGARVVSVVPSVTETLFALGVGASVVGVTTNCNYPPEAVSVAKVGDFNLNYEMIVSLEPTVVIGSRGFTDGARDVLARSGIDYFSVSHASLQEVVESIHALGILLDAGTAAEGIVEGFNAAIARAEARRAGASRVGVFWAQWNEPLSTVGPGNFHHDLIEFAGGRNIASDLGAPYGQFSEEVFAARDPDVVLAAGADTVAWVESRFPSSKAAVTHRVYTFSSDESARPGPRLVTALDELSRLLYPDAR
jgi:iron complex transport system substrate-binding protein